MSVVVMGMEMRGTCVDCDLYDKHYRHGMCKGHGVLFGPEDDWKYETRPNWCPLRPLPEKHGRLIDADEIEKLVAGYQEQADMHSTRAKELCGDSDTVSKFTWAYSQAVIYKRVINDLDTVLSSVPIIVEAEGDNRWNQEV